MQNKIKKGKQIKSHLVCLYGESGAGKTTFASQSPKPLFLEPPRENGSNAFDVDRIQIESWDEFTKTLAWFAKGEHEYKSVVLDTINRFQELLFTEICKQDEAKSIEMAHGGFGKGASVAFEVFRSMVDQLAVIREAGFNVIILCHARIIDHMDPTSDKSYKKYELSLYENKSVSFAGLIREFVDSVLFSKEKTYVAGEGKNARGSSDKEKHLFTAWDPAFYAKSRHQIPFELPFPKEAGWKTYVDAVEFSQVDKPEIFIERIERMLPNLKESTRAKVKAQLEKAAPDITALKSLDQKVQLAVRGEV